VPSPGDRAYFGIKGEDRQCSSCIVFENATEQHGPDVQFDSIEGDIAAISSGGRYKMVTQFLPNGNDIGRTEMTKALRIRIRSMDSSTTLRTFLFSCRWSIVNEMSRLIDDSHGIEAIFHPTLPIVAWKFSYFKMGFWLADLREDGTPIFIDSTDGKTLISIKEAYH
jgi:hypothetical protein